MTWNWTRSSCDYRLPASGALRLRVDDLSTDDCTVLLHHKGGVQSWHPGTPLFMQRLIENTDKRGGVGAAAGHQVLRTHAGSPITNRRYDNPHARFHRHLAWVEAKGVTVHWLRHTTLAFVEEVCGDTKVTHLSPTFRVKAR